MANELGMATMVSNDGEIFSAFGNARQNGLSAFRFDSATVVQPGQIVYLRDLDTGETDAPGFAPFQREDGIFEAIYEPGVATFAAARGGLTMDYVVFVPPDYPGDMRLLTLRNRGASPKRLRVAPFFDLALEDSPNESVDRIRDETVGSTLLFQNPNNDFERGFAFAATSFAEPATETIRARFFGGPGRNIHTPAMVETGAQRRCGARRRTAGRGVLRRDHAAPGGEAKIAIVLRPGAEPGGSARRRRARRRRRGRGRAGGDPRRLGGAARQGRGANQPAGLRPAGQHLAALPALRLAALGPRGPEPARRRDRLSRPAAGRAAADAASSRGWRGRRSCCTQASSFARATCSSGGIARPAAARVSASGPRRATRTSGCPTFSPATCVKPATRTVLDETTPFLEGEAVPAHEDTWIVVPRVSRETATVYEHARLAIDFTLDHLGANGLPLLRAGDWNDGIDVLGRARDRDQRLDGVLPLQRARRLHRRSRA